MLSLAVCATIEIGSIIADADSAVLCQLQYCQKERDTRGTLPYIRIYFTEVNMLVVINLPHHIDNLRHHRNHRPIRNALL